MTQDTIIFSQNQYLLSQYMLNNFCLKFFVFLYLYIEK